MSKRRTAKDPSAWTFTPAGHAAYIAARTEAQRKANELGMDHGLERNDLFKSFHVFMLPGKSYRQGHELRCEVVSPENLSKCQPGHGPCAVDSRPSR